jgi:RNA polymerase sigma-70 factor (ECF subfamily)
MAFYKGMSQREISTQTGIALGTIKTRLELALKKISFKLKELSGDSLPFPAAA